ncbi:MAG TPA: DapH/DapD/GlmU-related protein [Candidatus Nitrosocosmicus sp.]|nr:DapH/DapD/GlmU-related protein [Candidatus Nitrosocosmicus sp.]
MSYIDKRVKMRNWSIESFLGYLGKDYSLMGKERIQINNIAPIDKGTINDISFCSSEGKESLESVLKSRSGIILCKKDLLSYIHHTYRFNNQITKLFVFVDNPRLAFIKIAKLIKGYKDTRKGISNHAVIADSAKIGKDCYIGDFTIIGDDCVVGDNTVIDSRVTIKNAKVGNNCVIQAGTTIGEEGFSFERDSTRLELEKFPHCGGVLIGNNVEIFANCSIARGSISDTVIEEGTKIDALCHVAHNVHIGKNTQLTAGAVIGGSTKIGDYCWLGLNSTIKHKIKVGDNAIVGSGSSVIHDVEDKDIVAGCPAKSIKHKINISEDKLFLMGGQEHNKEQKGEETKVPRHQFSKKYSFPRQLGLTIICFVNTIALVML